MKTSYTREQVIALIDNMLEHAPQVTDALSNENSDWYGETLLSLSEDSITLKLPGKKEEGKQETVSVIEVGDRVRCLYGNSGNKFNTHIWNTFPVVTAILPNKTMPDEFAVIHPLNGDSVVAHVNDFEVYEKGTQEVSDVLTHIVNDLILIRNYFGKNDETAQQHHLFAVVDRIIKKIKEDALAVSTEKVDEVLPSITKRGQEYAERVCSGKFPITYTKEQVIKHTCNDYIKGASDQAEIGYRHVAKWIKMYAELKAASQPLSSNTVESADLYAFIEKTANEVAKKRLESEPGFVSFEGGWKPIPEGFIQDFVAVVKSVLSLSTPTVLTDESLQAEAEALFPYPSEYSFRAIVRMREIHIAAMKIGVSIDQLKKAAADGWDAGYSRCFCDNTSKDYINPYPDKDAYLKSL